MTKALMLSLVVALSWVVSASGETQAEFHPHYPGKFKINGANAWRNVAQENCALALISYYRIYERWPTTWNEVKQAGLYDRDLFGPQFQKIDPDDMKLDFEYDVVYQFRSGENPKIYTLAGKLLVSPLSPPKTYSQRLKRIEAQVPGFDADYWLGDVKRLTQLGLMLQLDNAIRQYNNEYGYPPKTVADLLTYGFSPISETSPSPFTGRPYRFNGGANDFLYTKGSLRPVDAFGVPATVYGFW